jgi:hypothetical protein
MNKEEKKIYLSGPMTGITDFNVPEFKRITAILRKSDYNVVSPVELDMEDSPTSGTEKERWCYFMERDLNVLMEPTVTSIVLMEGWQKSKGAVLEVIIAEAFGKEILVFIEDIVGFHLEPLLMKPVVPEFRNTCTEETEKVNILLEADNLVNGARQDSYGHPIDDYTRTAGLMSHLLDTKLKEPLTAEDAILCMCAVKLSREVNKHKRDNLVDLAGYAQCLQMVECKRQE